MKYLENSQQNTFFWLAILTFFVLLMPEISWGDVPTDEQGVIQPLCKVYTFIAGTAGKIISTLVIAITGFMVMLGKASVPLFLIIVGGIALVFGGKEIMQIVSGNPEDICKGL